MHHHYRLLAPHTFAGTDLLRTVEHAAIWRLMWSRPLPIVVTVGALAVVSLLVLSGRRRTRVP